MKESFFFLESIFYALLNEIVDYSPVNICRDINARLLPNGRPVA